MEEEKEEKERRRRTKLAINSNELPEQEKRRRIMFDPKYATTDHEYWATDDGEIYEIGWDKRSKRMKYYRLTPLKYGGHREGIKDMNVMRLGRKKIGYHLLIWCAWNGVIYDGRKTLVVEHINGNQLDNSAKNLKFKTRNGRVISFKGSDGKKKTVVMIDNPKFKTEEEYREEYEKIVEEAGSERNLLKRAKERADADNSIQIPSAVESNFIPEIEERIVQYIKAGAFLETAILAAGVSRPVYRSWIAEGKRDPDGRFGLFMKKVEEAMSQTEVLLASKVTNAAGRHWQAATWLLERKHPDRWKGNSEMQRTGSIQANAVDASKSLELSKLSIDELNFLRDLYKKQGKELKSD